MIKILIDFILGIKKIRFNTLLIFLLLSVNAILIKAQVEPDSLSGTSKAAVVVDGKILFYVRGITSYPAEKRAKVIERRIEEAAADLSVPANSLTVVQNEMRDDIFISGKFIMSVIEADANLEGVSRVTLVRVIKNNITRSIIAYREERTSKSLLNKAFYGIGATVITILLLFLINWIVKKFNVWFENKLKTKIDSLESRSFQMIRSRQLWFTFFSFVRGIKFFLFLIILFIYAQYILGLFPWTRAISISLLGFFLKPLSAFGNSILNFIPDLAFLIVIYFITKYLLKLIKLFFSGIEQGSIKIANFDPEWSIPSYKILRLLIVAFAVIVAYPYIPGSESDAFKGVSLFMGVLFSLGSSSLISNLIAGYTMTYRRTFKKGDMVKIEDYVGQVMDIKLFVTRLRTLKNEEVVVPNSIILNNNVINYSSLAAERGLILHTTVGIGYETSWRQVEDMLKTAAQRTEGILKDPPPYVLQKSLGDFAITYELNAFCNDPVNMMKHYTALHQNVLDVFNENNVQIMTPAYEGDPAEPKIVPKEKWIVPLAGQLPGKA